MQSLAQHQNKQQKLGSRLHPCLQLPFKFGQRRNQSSPDQTTFQTPKSPPRPSLPPTLLPKLPIANDHHQHHHHHHVQIETLTTTHQKNHPQPAKMRTTTLLLSLTATFLTSALAQDAYASGNATTTAIPAPANSIVAVEPCTESAPAAPMGSGGMPAVTASGTYNMPSGPSATGGPPAYTGAAVVAQVGGPLMVVAMGLPALV